MSIRPWITSTYLIVFTAVLILISGCGLYNTHHDTDPVYIKEDNCLVVEVIDGDTFISDDNRHIRLIGINAPEKGSFYFNESRIFLDLLIGGKEISLESDVEEYDQYQRTLSYIYFKDLFVNMEMVRNGFANVYTNPPNVKYDEIFLDAERFSRENELGLWEKSEIDKIDITIHYDAEGDDNNNLNDEYVYIENNSDKDFKIKGWSIKDAGRNEYIFKNTILKSNGSIYLFTGKGKDSHPYFYWNNTKAVWNNDCDTLYLRDSKGLLISLYNY